MITLALDSSTSHASAALLVDRDPVARLEYTAGRGANPRALYQFLADCRLRHQPPQRIVVGIGPGSYSGVRIAIATAIGLATASSASLLGLPSVLGLRVDEPRFRVVGDARRETAYHAVVDGARCLRGPELLARHDLEAELASDPGLPLYSPAPPDWLDGATLARPDAARLAEVSLAADAAPVDGGSGLEPLYLRPPHITTPKPA